MNNVDYRLVLFFSIRCKRQPSFQPVRVTKIIVQQFNNRQTSTAILLFASRSHRTHKHNHITRNHAKTCWCWYCNNHNRRRNFIINLLEVNSFVLTINYIHFVITKIFTSLWWKQNTPRYNHACRKKTARQNNQTKYKSSPQ